MSKSEWFVDQATEHDADWIAWAQVTMAYESEAEELDPPTVRAGVQHVFENPERMFYIVARRADDDGASCPASEPIGCLLVQKEWSEWRNAEVWWLHSLYVAPDWRKRGVFRGMYEELLRRAREAGAKGVRLIVHKQNARAQQVYRSIGMTPDHYDLYEVLF